MRDLNAGHSERARKRYESYYDRYKQKDLTDINIEYADTKRRLAFLNIFGLFSSVTALCASIDIVINKKIELLIGIPETSTQFVFVACMLLLLAYVFWSISLMTFKISVLDDLRREKKNSARSL